ncbi:MAG: asparagine--tRNA ligase [Candidatus Aenigmatarchaeota archaeon]|nr:MAG: asparagine--tRNA ligase [Candidatus Aenigmarchaeota archaeon]
MDFMSVREAMEQEGGTAALRGWCSTVRTQKTTVFIILRDGTGHIQVTFKESDTDAKTFKAASELTTESSVTLTGTVAKDARAPGGFEVKGRTLDVVQLAEPYPIARDKSPEFLMDQRHLWIRSPQMTAILRVRSTVFGAIHEYFRSQNYFEFQSPTLTKAACEGGPTLFKVDYFGDEVFLTQSWQLYAEAGIHALEKIYCIAPSFRAEKSRTTRHLTEYWHAECEAAWMDLDGLARVAEGLISHICARVAEKNPEDLRTLGRDPNDLLKITPPFPRITYTEALDMLAKKDGIKIKWGKDLRTEEERAIAQHFERPVIVTRYPKEIMAFYKPADPKDPKVALCFDVLCPELGTEIIGGSQRDADVKAMIKALKKEGADPKFYDWYFATRRYGGVPHSGFGMGVERVIQWICKLEHIRDTIPFPRMMNRYYP